MSEGGWGSSEGCKDGDDPWASFLAVTEVRTLVKDPSRTPPQESQLEALGPCHRIPQLKKSHSFCTHEFPEELTHFMAFFGHLLAHPHHFQLVQEGKTREGRGLREERWEKHLPLAIP